MAPLISIKAGRSFRVDETNRVESNPEKGLLTLEVQDDLIHLGWRSRETQTLHDDLILFPQDGVFEKVDESSGRVYVLRFESSDSKHFFYLQTDLPAETRSELATRLNTLINDPSSASSLPPLAGLAGSTALSRALAGPDVPGADDSDEVLMRVLRESLAQSSRGVPVETPLRVPGVVQRGDSALETPAPLPGTEPPVPPAAPRAQRVQPSTAQAGMTTEQMRQLRELLSCAGQRPDESDIHLTDILTPTLLSPLLSNPDLLRSIFPHLPPSLPEPHDTSAIRSLVSSPQFQASVRSLEQVLNTGALGALVEQLGLPREAAAGVEAFLRAIGDQARRGGEGEGQGDRMETD